MEPLDPLDALPADLRLMVMHQPVDAERVTIRKALYESRNVVTVKLLEKLGAGTAANTAFRMGITTKLSKKDIAKREKPHDSPERALARLLALQNVNERTVIASVEKHVTFVEQPHHSLRFLEGELNAVVTREMRDEMIRRMRLGFDVLPKHYVPGGLATEQGVCGMVRKSVWINGKTVHVAHLLDDVTHERQSSLVILTSDCVQPTRL